jgi:hypothetical protein
MSFSCYQWSWHWREKWQVSKFLVWILGHKLLTLDNRLDEARKISEYKFESELKDKEWEITNKIFTETQSALSKYLTTSEASIFIIATPGPVNLKGQDPYLRQRVVDWHWHVNCIIAKKDELKKIIERLG